MAATEKDSHPPIVLVKTWLMLLKSDSDEVRDRAMLMLINAFGDMKAAQKFCEDHKLIQP